VNLNESGKPMEKPAGPDIEHSETTATEDRTRTTKVVAKPGQGLAADEEEAPEESEKASADTEASAKAETDPAAATDVKKSPVPAHARAHPANFLSDDPAPIALGAADHQQTNTGAHQQPDDSTSDDTAMQQIAAIADLPEAPAPAAPASSDPDSHVDSAQALMTGGDLKAPAAQTLAATRVAPPPPPAPPEVHFAETNHPQIVTGIHGQLLPDGGTMRIRLDPPELGALQVMVHMRDGVMTASFETSNDEATKLLSHSLVQLRHALETQGVSVDKLHVQQGPRDQQAGNEDGRDQHPSDNPSARQEQQRREILQRMWRKLANGSDPLDMVA